MSLNLSLFRCSVCKRAFFDSKRRDDHILASHGATSLKVTQTKSSREHKHPHEQLSFETAADTNVVRNCEFTENSIKDTPPTTVKRLRLSSLGTDKKNVTNARHYTRRRLSCQFQYLVKHLDCLWPPTEQNVKLQALKRFRRLRWLISKMPGHNYSHEKHAHVKVVDVLNEEFDNRNQLDDHRVKNIQGKTGLSQLYIKAWFKWKRNLELRTGPKKVLQETFYSCQYPSKEKTKMIATVIGSTPNKVESWFLLSRVVSDILDPSENDTKELVLRRLFNLRSSEGLQNSDVKVASYLLDMKSDVVMKIFQIWCQRFGAVNRMDPASYEPNDLIPAGEGENLDRESTCVRLPSVSLTTNSISALGGSKLIAADDSNENIAGNTNNITPSARDSPNMSKVDERDPTSLFPISDHFVKIEAEENHSLLSQGFGTYTSAAPRVVETAPRVAKTVPRVVNTAPRTTETTPHIFTTEPSIVETTPCLSNENIAKNTIYLPDITVESETTPCLSNEKAKHTILLPNITVESPASYYQEPDLTDHSLVEGVLRKLRRKQGRRGIPYRVNISGHVVRANKLVAKAKKRKSKPPTNCQSQKYLSFLEESLPRDKDVIFVKSWKKVPEPVEAGPSESDENDFSSILRICKENDIAFTRNSPEKHEIADSFTEQTEAAESLYNAMRYVPDCSSYEPSLILEY